MSTSALTNPLQLTRSSLTMLEWPEFLQFYAGFAASPAGREEALVIRPPENLSDELALTSEALGAAMKDQIPALGSLENLTSLLQRAAIENATLEGVELYRVYRLLSVNNEVRGYAAGWAKEFPGLHAATQKLPDLRVIEHEIESKIDPTGMVKEDATEELHKLHRQIWGLKARVEHALERFLRDSRYQPALQEDYVTYRHGRAVLVVRADQKSMIRGVVHGQSGSGASLFLEPMHVLELNNELAELNDQLDSETQRILSLLTAAIGKDADLILYAMKQLVRLDLIFARGRFGKAFRCTVPLIASDFRMNLIEARHPLLEATLRKQNRAVVPLSVELPPDRKALVVTGPNTGGKTVFLKTIGLLSLMAHHAVPIPAAEGSTVPRFSSVLADIGDQQSIAESLSTFSSHMQNIRAILSDLRECSLVLLDELGTGTDPEEGAPLAVSILQELLQHDVKAVITSHHSQMKIFAVNNPECVVAAMEFDEQNLAPTYRVHLDQVGSSHAFDIAERLGLPAHLLERARGMMGEDRRQLMEFQARLQERIHTLTERQEQLEREKNEWEMHAARQQEKLDSMQSKLEAQLKTLKDQNTDLIRTINAKVEKLIEAIKDSQVRQQIRKQYKQEVAPALSDLENLTATPEKEKPLFEPGERVWVQMYRDYGKVVALKKDQAEVLIRNIRFTVPVGTLEKRETIQETLPKGVQFQYEEKDVPPEINVIGQTVEQALEAVDKYLDDAVLAQLPEVRIIHGHGMGKLKRAIAEMLAKHPQVRAHREESPQRGGAGVTVAIMK